MWSSAGRGAPGVLSRMFHYSHSYSYSSAPSSLHITPNRGCYRLKFFVNFFPGAWLFDVYVVVTRLTFRHRNLGKNNVRKCESFAANPVFAVLFSLRSHLLLEIEDDTRKQWQTTGRGQMYSTGKNISVRTPRRIVICCPFIVCSDLRPLLTKYNRLQLQDTRP